METIGFKMTWCDYLTPCPHNPGVDVGSYECSQCSSHRGMTMKSNHFDLNGKLDASKYFIVHEGSVQCCGKEAEWA